MGNQYDDDNEVYDADFAEISTESDSDKKEEKRSDDRNFKNSDRYCSMCRRPESVTGKLVDLPNGMCVCNDCLQKTTDYIKGPSFNLGSIFQGLKDLSNISFMNLDGFGGLNAQEDRNEKKQPERKFTMQDIMPPHKIKAQLDRYVVGQEHAKKAMSVAVYNHYKRIIDEQRRAERAEQQGKELIPDPNVPEPVEIQKSNILMIGPTGSGKTYIVQTLAKLLDVPLALTDATSLTEAGYIGDDIESVVSKLLAAAGNDVSRAEHGIIFIDEIDKIAKKKNTHSRDVSGEAVQQGMLKLLEGADVEVPVGASSKNAMVPLKTVNTKNILFICGGAFPDLEEIIKERLTSRSSIGFSAELKDTYDDDPNIMHKVTTEDLRKFGMIPEFLGRLPIVFSLDAVTKDMLVRILNEPQNAILRQYEALLAMDEVKLTFERDALEAIAEKAMKKDTGARALRSIIEEFMLDIMYEIPKDDSIGEVVITKEYVNHTGGPRIMLRG